MKKITRLVSWLLLVAMVASMVFTTALAEEDPVAPAEENTEITEIAEVPAEQPDEEDETLTAVEPQIIAQPEDMAAYIGETAQFTVGVEGVVSSVRWQYSKDGGVNWSFLNASYDGLTLSFTVKELHNGFCDGFCDTRSPPLRRGIPPCSRFSSQIISPPASLVKST